MEIDMERAEREAYKIGLHMLEAMMKQGEYAGVNPYPRGTMEWNGFNDAMNAEATGDDHFNKELSR